MCQRSCGLTWVMVMYVLEIDGRYPTCASPHKASLTLSVKASSCEQRYIHLCLWQRSFKYIHLVELNSNSVPYLLCEFEWHKSSLLLRLKRLTSRWLYSSLESLSCGVYNINFSEYNRCLKKKEHFWLFQKIHWIHEWRNELMKIQDIYILFLSQ